MSAPLYLTRNAHRTWLKWHRGRRRASDPVFTGARILEAMQLGASVEIDLVIHADRGFAVLHDKTLERETTGSGRVVDTHASKLRTLHLRAEDGTPIPDHVMLLEDLSALLAEHQPHPEALLQLDFKEDLSALDPIAVANFASAVAPIAKSLILSGGDADAIALLAANTPGLRTGYDPCYGASLARLQATGDFATFTADALTAAADAEMIYLHYGLILEADRAGFDIIAALHADHRRVDAWTIKTADDTTKPAIDRLLDLRVDQITTDDPEGVLEMMGSR
ncbi:MAG: glycerophosphodiester phosphodiesterase [Devosia sp.]|jgi:glycerophosphoryl diester phosphodiesterase|uniref:glycerophosphodiester phosphodiesterase n=1 Tax=Devosia sp. TaxID=1871048 RepID=UPI0019FC4FD0|nr:glycerophosphodiester phosphodiesterase family protein [Devosia sp.]MBF0677685.1 glycerophosphodiester phosphodiesterase [Devosia sp.]